ncbi:uncharacterized protein JCM15063_004881 [Sporobolomyces koalae]|uniref:uncharacterized protein n=1 Tax=Sporobolomyces koalae TaxID=500713 RepID=UPI0031806ACD
MSTLFPPTARSSPRRPRPTKSPNRPSVLPDLPRNGPSFSDEVQRGVQNRLSTASSTAGGGGGSILFPAPPQLPPSVPPVRPESEDEGSRFSSTLFPPVPVRRRSQSTPVDVSIRNSAASTLLPYARPDPQDESDDDVDADAETEPAVKPARTPKSNRHSRSHRRTSSLDSSGLESSTRRRSTMPRTTTAMDYLLLEEQDREERPIDETPRTRNKRLALLQEQKRLEAEPAAKRTSTVVESPVESRRNTVMSTGQNGHSDMRADQQFSREEAWYFVRALVGQEIKHEQSLLWKLQHLDTREDLLANGYPVYEDSIPPTELPILRYLLKHFLLTLPLVRDVHTPSGVPTFWTEGLYPIIRSVHAADFSQPVDRSGASGIPTLHDSPLRNALERFVAAGLKLSAGPTHSSTSETPEFTSDTEATPAPAMDRQGTASTTGRYNFQATVPPPEVTPPIETATRSNGTTHARTSSASKRFSFSRFFNGSAPAPVITDIQATSAPPVLGAALPTTATREAEETQSNGMSSSASWKRLSNAISLAPPIPHVFPNRPDSATIAPFPRTTAQEPESPIVNSESTFAPVTLSSSSPSHELAPEPERPGPYRHNSITSRNARRTDTESIGFTSGLEDGASFVSARDANTTEEGESDYEVVDRDNEVEELTARVVQDPTKLAASVGMQKQKSEGEKTIGKPEEPEPVEGYTVEDSTAEEPVAVASGGSSTPEASTRTAPTPATPSAPVATPIFPNSSTTISPASTPVQEKRSSKFGLAGLLRNKRSRNKTSDSVPHSGAAPSSRQVPVQAVTNPPHREEEYVAHMAIPTSLMWPQPQESTTEGGSDYLHSSAMPSGQPVILQKSGVEWPFQEDVMFDQTLDFEQLKWGGFEADIVGVRRTIFTVNYIIRVRRPARLDEFVLRSESQFIKFWRTLDKSFPNAHIRRIPAGDPKNDVVIRPRPSLPAIGSTPTLGTGMHSTPSLASTAGAPERSRFLSGMQVAAADPHNPDRPPPVRSQSVMSSSNFARSLRAQSLGSGSEDKAARARRVRSATFSQASTRRAGSAFGSYRSFGATSFGSKVQLPIEIGKKMPPHDKRRRALRSWLRDVLAVRTVGHNLDLAKFLLSGSEVPKDSDVIDIAKRELIDEARRSARLAAAQSSIEKVRTLRNYWNIVEEEIIHHDGLSELSSTLREVPAISKLPLKYQKVLETLRFEFAQTLYETLVAGTNSGATFAKVKSMHAAFPYFLVRQALRLGGSTLMARALQDILVSRPFGGKSLLQKILATCLDDDPARLAAAMDRTRAKIGSNIMCQKLEQFVRDSREKKNIIRRYAEENDIELVLCIVRGADEPRLPAYLLTRIRKAQVAYRKFAKTDPSPLVKAQVQDPDVRLVLELQTYLRLASQDRDAAMMREMLANEEFAAAIEVVAQPFIALLKRTYRIGNAAQLLSELQTFMNQLIIIVEALRSRIQEPQKSIRVLARLLSRHDQSLYTFVRAVHRKETIVEEFLQWLWTASVFLRRGLAEPVNVDDLVPPHEQDEKAYLLDELEELTAYHHEKRYHELERSCRRFAGDVQEDDPILVEGDGKGKSRIEPISDDKPVFPTLSEIPLYANKFRDQLKNVFAF